MLKCTTSLQITSETENPIEVNKKASQGDFSLSGVIMLNLISKTGGKFKARTLLDSGAGTNFISSKILPYLKYDNIDSEGLVVTGINSTSSKKHDLINIHLNSRECPVKQVKYYVLPELIEYEVNKIELKQMLEECKSISDLKDPFGQEADHKEGISIVIGPGATRDISYAPPLWHGKYTIDRTYFGPAVSGRMQRQSSQNLKIS